MQWPASEIEGFEEWNLPMIRDFIGCMDTARKKYATLKEQDPDGPVSIFVYLFTVNTSLNTHSCNRRPISQKT